MKGSIPSNPILERLPKHLFQYVKPQNYDMYSSIDQAVWRYVMNKNISVFPELAHESYLEGLKKTGISANSIPSMYGMNRILQDIGWAAVAVDGFIPPQAFMEFQAYNVLVIASDIRQVNHIEYTPAPDIIHESAGHAPIIANPDYAEYLRRFGEIGCKAISSGLDVEMYEAVRLLSILKETLPLNEKRIAQVTADIEQLQQRKDTPSEMSMIRNLHWWSVEYGLIGTLENPKIYGAGLLSSIGESKSCMSDNVKKLPYTIEAAHMAFDITKPQPQLFVTPDFAHLSQVLEEFADTMALRKGGLAGVQKVINSKTLGTVELNTGLQISGLFTEVISCEGRPIYIKTAGETALSHHGSELIGHNINEYPDGFGTALGPLKGINLAIEDMSPRDLKHYNIYEGKHVTLEFLDDLIVSGDIVTGTRSLKGKITLIKFKNCTVKHKERKMFKPDMGVYHMAVGQAVVSVFSGPADNASFNRIIKQPFSNHSLDKTSSLIELESLYNKVDQLFNLKTIDQAEIVEISSELLKSYKNEWLLRLRLVELLKKHDCQKLLNVHLAVLSEIAHNNPGVKHLIDDGLSFLNLDFDTEELVPIG